MVQSSYKNRKKNRKQSFKRKNTDGNRKVKFIDDDDKKMVGGNVNQIAITGFMNKYNKHPIYGVLLAIYSNQLCAVLEPGTNQCRDDNTATLDTSYKKSKAIMGQITVVDDKPTALTQDELKDKKVKDGKKLEYVREVIDYLAQNVFIPKDSIQHVYVHNDDGASWTKLTNGNFNKGESETLGKRDAAVNAGEKIQIAANEGKVYTKGEIGEIETIIKTLGNIETAGDVLDKFDKIDEDIVQLKKLVNNPADQHGTDFENIVHNLNVDDITATNLTEAFGKWKTAMLVDITQADIKEEEQEEPNDIDKTTGIANSSSAGSGALPSATTGPHQQERLEGAQLEEAHANVHERIKQITDIVNTEGGNDEEKRNNMRRLVIDLRDLFRKIVDSSANSGFKKVLYAKIGGFDKIIDQRSFEDMSTTWNEQMNK